MKYNLHDFNLEEFDLIPIVDVIHTNEMVETYDIEVDNKNYFYVTNPENNISEYIVSHNSAEIALGDPDDVLYMRAKNWSTGTIPNWRGMSNNTLYVDDYSHLMEEFWSNGYEINSETGNANGEPYGFFNLPLSQKYGRLKDGPMKDSKLYPADSDNVVGTNPCLVGDTKIITDSGEISIKEVVNIVNSGKILNCLSYCNDKEEIELQQIIRGQLSKSNANIIELELEDGEIIRLTPDHRVFTENRGYIKSEELTSKDVLVKVKSKNIEIKEKCAVEKLKIKRINATENADVYDISVNKNNNFFANNILVHNCGEISLANFECCNLAELYLNNIETEEELSECAHLLYKTQKAIAALPFIHEETNKVVHKNMRLGLGVTGICQSFHKIEWLDRCYVSLRKFDKEWSKQRGWPESIKLTTAKPSGTLSLLGGSTPGVHPAYSKYYYRTIRMSSNDKLVQICKDLGYHIEFLLNFDGSQNHDTVIVYFPCETPAGALLAKNTPLVEQLNLVKRIQEIWSDNAVSITAYYKPEELNDLKAWLKKHYKNSIKSLSFLLHKEHGFKQAPYQEIDEETYIKAKSKVKPLSEFITNAGDGEMIHGIECEGGACPIR